MKYGDEEAENYYKQQEEKQNQKKSDKNLYQ